MYDWLIFVYVKRVTSPTLLGSVLILDSSFYHPLTRNFFLQEISKALGWTPKVVDSCLRDTVHCSTIMVIVPSRREWGEQFWIKYCLRCWWIAPNILIQAVLQRKVCSCNLQISVTFHSLVFHFNFILKVYAQASQSWNLRFFSLPVFVLLYEIKCN